LQQISARGPLPKILNFDQETSHAEAELLQTMKTPRLMEGKDLEERKAKTQNIMSTSRTNERRKSHNMAYAFEQDYIRDSSSFHPTVNIENTIV
jgi:hypothetical protein